MAALTLARQGYAVTVFEKSRGQADGWQHVAGTQPALTTALSTLRYRANHLRGMSMLARRRLGVGVASEHCRLSRWPASREFSQNSLCSNTHHAFARKAFIRQGTAVA